MLDNPLYGQVLKSDLMELEQADLANLAYLYNKNILIFGGTGFLGTWLTTSLLFLNERMNLNLTLTIITRNEKEAKTKFPNIRLDNVDFIEWDLKKASSEVLGQFDILISGPTPSTKKTLGPNQSLEFRPAKIAAETILDIAKRFGNNPQVINLSSGAVYRQSRLVDRPLEETDFLSTNPLNPYQEDKLLSELALTSLEANNFIKLINLRLFAFFGPLLALDEHFAIGNFFLDGMSNRPIKIGGNPNTKRSYLYPTDFVSAILELLSGGHTGTFNLGGSKTMTMYQLASEVGQATSNKHGNISCDETIPANFYYPDTSKLLKDRTI